MSQKFNVTEAYFRELCAKGYSIQEIADDITNRSGIKCTPNRVRQAAKVFGVSLREKPRNNPFNFVKDGDDSPISEQTQPNNTPQNVVETTNTTQEAVVANVEEVTEESSFTLQ